ncbi:tyrosine-type recombinase/integrase [Heliophilum fasciatum]|uniref:Site-specific recombinase XerD n=1 Tax=Heliophilum fasciatum TaxID=35700 RepID=A0A4R2RHF1_9FIRM|nr:tyrosine-type recombinase/integrase [Heliophilum fasciatum]MCW2279522.1 integrase [Heliophilum fasciatum]TCP58615.1 site-specific recombinase XerD [Heliophilum fasciatum]
MITDNKITRQIETYIEYKQSLGYQLKTESQELRRFANYTRGIDYSGSLTVDLAMQWASLNANFSRWYMARRLETVHTFAVYVACIDPNAQVPQTGAFGKCHGRVEPYIYTEKEIRMLMDEALKLFATDGIRGLTVSIALGLLWATGIRVSELTRLTVKDVNLKDGYLFIKNTKFFKERLIPLHPSAIKELENYNLEIQRKSYRCSQDDFFFVTSHGKPFNLRAFEYAFQLLRHCLLPDGVKDWNRRSPRLYDIRHTFACRTILKWYESGEDVNRMIYVLSVYMGHVKPADTYWYLTATPELLSIACKKFEFRCGKGWTPYE